MTAHHPTEPLPFRLADGRFGGMGLNRSRGSWWRPVK